MKKVIYSKRIKVICTVLLLIVTTGCVPASNNISPEQTEIESNEEIHDQLDTLIEEYEAEYIKQTKPEERNTHLYLSGLKEYLTGLQMEEIKECLIYEYHMEIVLSGNQGIYFYNPNFERNDQ